ncbi:sensor domain-containing diguanylate cyclase [Natronospirillum operosum]|uniref:diguanylate cyclase n=1 Tax=Natronospirillum operosum TaxID=2759953 RepID=A0A4Z0W8U5_9GAMM|nr:GGDEF domain-containing protein [Natronospirillum operosum]TGG95039.1 sensor domain-containing diguanylate cyclase [Natronospirillum operosum]
MDNQQTSIDPVRQAAKVAIVYGVVAFLWIALSDWLLQQWVADPERLTQLQTFKGWGFVIVTSLALFAIMLHFLRITARHVRRQDEQSRQLHGLGQFRESIIDNASIWINVLDPQSRITVWNKAAEQISGYRREEVFDNPAIWEWLYPDPDYRQEVMTKVTDILERGAEVKDFETCIRSRDGQEKFISWNSRRFFDENGHMIGSIAIGLDITERREMERELARLAASDSLTGLATRRELEKRFQEESARSLRYQNPLSLLMVDVDNFKQINDDFSHHVGDEVLRQLSGRLQRTVREVDHIGRYGGDELVILLPEMDAPEASAMAERIRRSVEADSLQCDGVDKPIKLTVSIGVASYPTHEQSPDNLFGLADRAMYLAKQSGRNCVRTAADSQAQGNSES